MRIRFLLGVLLAVAISFAPLAVPGGKAMAAAPAHHSEMTGAHCADQTRQDQSKQEKAKPCCPAGCMVSATLPAKAAEPLALPKPQLRPAAEQFHRGTLSEIATPPPRLS